MNNYKKTEEQKRLTLIDTKNKQAIMREYFDEKTRNPVVIEEDKKVLPSILADALLSQPALSGLKPSIELKGVRIPLAGNVYDLLLKILYAESYKKNEEYYIKFTLRGKTYEIKMTSLWKLLFELCNQLSAGAIAESLTRSKEKETRHIAEVKSFSEESENQE